MPYLANALADWINRGHRKKELYEESGLSSGYITQLFAGQLPKPDTLAKILATVDEEDAKIFLRAYLMDDIPDGWRDRVEITIIESGKLGEELPADPIERRKKLIQWLEKQTAHSSAALKIVEGLYEMCHGIPTRRPD